MIDFSAFNQLYINGAEVSSLLLNGIKIWEKPSSPSEDIIPDDELWYTTSDKQAIIPANLAIAVETTYDAEKDKGIIKFLTTITAIPDGFFYNKNTCTSLKMPDSVKTIGYMAFQGLSNLKSVKLSCNLETIGARAFADTGLESIVFPASLKDMGTNLFYNNRNIKHIEFLGEEAPLGINPFLASAKYGKVIYPNNSSYDKIMFGTVGSYPGYDSSLIKDLLWNVKKLYLDTEGAIEIISNTITKRNRVITFNRISKFVYILDNDLTRVVTNKVSNLLETVPEEYYGLDSFPYSISNANEFDKEISEETFIKNYIVNIPLVWEEEAETTLDWGVDDLENQITPDPLTRDYATELVDNMTTSKYEKLKFTKPSESGDFGYYGDGIDGLITLCTYATTKAIYASSTQVEGDLNLLTTWKNAGAEVAMCHIDKPIARYGNSFIFAGPKDVNVLGFCVVSSHVAHDTRYNRCILCLEPDGTKTADGRTCVTVSNSNFYDGSPDGYIVAVMYK